MPTICSASNCRNSIAKGFSLMRFPRDLKRRMEWQVQMNRDNWTPTNNSRLCEIHFAPEMWEQNRADGWRKLRPNAVPTLFSFSTEPQKQKTKLPVQIDSIIKRPCIKEPTISLANNSSNNILIAEILIPEPMLITSTTQTSAVIKGPTSINNKTQTSEHLHTKLKDHNKIYAKNKAMQEYYKKKFKKSKLKYSQLECQITKNIAGNFFSIDQITALKKMKNSKATIRWSDNTIIKALKLKLAPSNSEYDEILKQNLFFCQNIMKAAKLKI